MTTTQESKAPTIEMGGFLEAVQSLAIAVDRFHDRKPKVFSQEWITLGPSQDEDSGMIRISDISAIIRIDGYKEGRDKGANLGVEIRLKSGDLVTAPEADYELLKLTIMAVGSAG